LKLSLDEDAAQIASLRNQLHKLNQQLQALLDKRNKRRKRRSVGNNVTYSSPMGTAPSKPKTKTVKKEKKKKRAAPTSDEDEAMPVGDITYEQKRELSDNINILPSDKLPTVFEIIKENTHLNVSDANQGS
jgi:bromodomain-containing factor 1